MQKTFKPLYQYSLILLAIIWVLLCLTGCQKPLSEAERYQDLVTTLTEKSTNSKLVFDSLYLDSLTQEDLPGWQLTRINLIENHSFYYVESKGGTLAQLKKWGEANQFDINVDKNGIALVKSIQSLPALAEASLMNLSDASAYLLDAMGFWFPNKPLPEFKEDIAFNNKAYFTREISIPIAQYSYQDLVDLGTLLDGLPLSFSYADLTVSNVNGLQGVLTLQLTGVQ